MISISTLTIAWGAVCGRKTFFCFSLILLCRFHSALFFFFFDSLKKNQNVSNGANLAGSTITTFAMPIFQKMERKETWTHWRSRVIFWLQNFLCFQLLLRSIRTVIFWQVSLVVLSSQKEVALNFDGSFTEKGPHSTLQPLLLLAVQWRRTFRSTTKICMSPDGFWQSFFRRSFPYYKSTRFRAPLCF